MPGESTLVPGAAADFPAISDDGLVYTFTLRDDLKFADGTAVTAADYVRSWARIGLDGDVSGLMQLYIADVEALDDLTVEFTLTAPFGFFDALSAAAPLIPSNPATFSDAELVFFPETLDGIGPYRMVSYTVGEQMVLEANPEYFGDDAPMIPNVIIRYFADPTTMA